MSAIFNEYCEILTEFLAQWGISLELGLLIAALILWLLLYIGRGLAFFRFLMRWYQRLIILAGLIALGFWLFYIGREHKIYLDNKAMNDYKPFEQVNVSINGGTSAELMARDRDLRKVVGPEFELKAEVLDDNGEIVSTVTKTINLGFSKDIMINLPVLVGGSGDFIVPAPR